MSDHLHLRYNAKSFLWGLRHLPSEGRILKMSFQEFCVAGYKMESFLSCPIWYVRNIGIKLIGAHSLVEYEEFLKLKCQDRKEVPIIRRNALRNIQTAGFQLNSDFLFGCLNDPYWEVRSEALRALAHNSTPADETTAKLVNKLFNVERSSLRETNLEVLMHYVASLGIFGTSPRAQEALSLLAKHGNWLIRAQTAIALNHLCRRFPDTAQQITGVLETIDPQSDGIHPVFLLKKTLAHTAASIESSSSLAPLSFIDLSQGWQP